MAIDMVSSLGAEHAIEVMKHIGQICDRRGDQHLRAAAHKPLAVLRFPLRVCDVPF